MKRWKVSTIWFPIGPWLNVRPFAECFASSAADNTFIVSVFSSSVSQSFIKKSYSFFLSVWINSAIMSMHTDICDCVAGKRWSFLVLLVNFICSVSNMDNWGRFRRSRLNTRANISPFWFYGISCDKTVTGKFGIAMDIMHLLLEWIWVTDLVYFIPRSIIEPVVVDDKWWKLLTIRMAENVGAKLIVALLLEDLFYGKGPNRQSECCGIIHCCYGYISLLAL